MTDAIQGERVAIYGVQREFSGEWRVVSATARVTDKLYIIDDRDDRSGFGYRTRIQKDDRRVFMSARAALLAAIEREGESVAALQRKITVADKAICELTRLLAALDATAGQTPPNEG
jgi:hypothetical protein